MLCRVHDRFWALLSGILDLSVNKSRHRSDRQNIGIVPHHTQLLAIPLRQSLLKRDILLIWLRHGWWIWKGWLNMIVSLDGWVNWQWLFGNLCLAWQSCRFCIVQILSPHIRQTPRHIRSLLRWHPTWKKAATSWGWFSRGSAGRPFRARCCGSGSPGGKTGFRQIGQFCCLSIHDRRQ